MNECFCIGPQNGEPKCPCEMQYITIKKGRYIETIDHGPVVKEYDPINNIDNWKLVTKISDIVVKKGGPYGI